MLRLDTATTSLALLLMGCAGIVQPAIEPESGRYDEGQASPWGGYTWTEAREIPDGDRQGTLIGPVFTKDDGLNLGPVALRLDIRHPAVGDLDLWLAYDADGDGNPETRAPIEFFRMRSDIRAEQLYACPQSLDGTYFFRDDAGEREALFAPFNVLRRGHAFYLAVVDSLAEDTGSVLGWAIYVEEPEPPALR